MAQHSTATAIRELVRADILTKPLERIVGHPTTDFVFLLKEQLAKKSAGLRTTAWIGSYGNLPLILNNEKLTLATNGVL